MATRISESIRGSVGAISVGSRKPKPVRSRGFRVVTYDLEEFVVSTDPEYPVRYELLWYVDRDGVTIKYVLRLFGVSLNGHLMEYRERRSFVMGIDDAEAKQWLKYVDELIEKLGAKPGRYEPL